jgi:two-component system response regulator MtrA
MSVLAVSDPTAPTDPTVHVPTRRGVSGRPRSSGSNRLWSVDPATAGAATPSVLPSSVEPSVEPSAEPVTVTISIAASGPERRNRVLAALRELIEAAGPDAAVAGSSSLPSSVPSPVLSSGPGEASVVLDPLPRTVLRDGSPLELSRLEYDLLLFLAEHPRQVFSRSQLLGQVWGHTHTSARTIDVHVSRLRTKLGPDSDVITTVYGLGYRLSDDVPVAVIRR